MGLYLQGYAKRKSRFGLPPRTPFHERLGASITSWAEKKGIGPLTRVTVVGPAAVVFCIYPPAGTTKFAIAADSVSLDAKTSMAGPGYHAALIELCDHIAADVGLAWMWDLPGGRSGDDTGYAVHRDRARLEASFLDQYIGQLRWLEQQREGLTNIAMNLPMELMGPSHAGVKTPLGPFTPAALCESLAADPAGQAQAATDFYPWWGEPLGEAFWRKTLLALLWVEAIWRKPRNDHETAVHRAIFAAAGQMRALGKDLPGDVETALRELRDAIDGDTPPPPRGIGYWRGDVLFQVSPTWWVEVPGWFIQQQEDKTLCFWFGDVELRASAFTMTKKEPERPASWSKGFVDAIEHETKHFRFRVQREVERTKDGCCFAMACCMRDAPGTAEILLLTLTDKDPERHLERLTEFARNVTYWPPAKPARPDAN